MKFCQNKSFFKRKPILDSVKENIISGLGFSQEDFKKPLIAIVNSWNELAVGHLHLDKISYAVKQGVFQVGGIPIEFNIPAPCDIIAMGNEGMKYILPLRDSLADNVEAMIKAHAFNGAVMISSCDKVNPAMLMASARLEIPVICMPGGFGMMKSTILKGDFDKKINTGDDSICCTVGSCGLMGTANTTQCLIESVGMCLPGYSVTPAFSQEKLVHARETGKKILELVKKNITPKKIITEKSLRNAIMINHAIGGSTNFVIHLIALANELGIKIDIDLFNYYNKKIPTLLGIKPNGNLDMLDFYNANGIVAVMKELEKELFLDCLTVTGMKLKENIKRFNLSNNKILGSKEKPFFDEGAIVILKGNLAPEGAVVKQSAVKKDLHIFKGKAKVFDDEESVINALLKKEIEERSVIVLKCMGPKGAPGMPELLSITLELLKMKHVALVTDSRFSGASIGLCVGHVSPEAYVRGPIAIVEDNDIIEINIPKRSINLEVEDKKITERLQRWKPKEIQINSKFLQRYRRDVISASQGAVLK